MSIELIGILLGYGVASFLTTTLFVRWRAQGSLVQQIRRHVCWFPLMPPLIFLYLSGKILLWLWRVGSEILRRYFELLSGKKMYRRRKVRDYYFRY